LGANDKMFNNKIIFGSIAGLVATLVKDGIPEVK
jgi:hypothetical protein